MQSMLVMNENDFSSLLPMQFFVPDRSQQILVTTSRYKIPVEKPFVIQ